MKTRSGKGTRYINGKYYLLGGRTSTKEGAEAEARTKRERGLLVRIIKLSDWDFMVYEFPKEGTN